jgi:hypothetical protein
MLFKVDSHFGHVVEETDKGVIYRDDGALVDWQNPRPCLGCKAKCGEGSHDPCIANLPGTSNACCGHGLDVTPVNHNANGYVALDDGRTFRFSGLVGGERIRQAVDAALKGDSLPEGFVFDEQKMWWSGLSDTQRQYVQANLHAGLVRLVTEVLNGQSPSPQVISGEAMWYEGLAEEQKAQVWARTGDLMQELVQEALAQPV